MKKKMKILAFLVAMTALLGMSMCNVAAVDPPDDAGDIPGTISHDQYATIWTPNFVEGKEVYLKLVVEDPYPGLDLDLEVYGPGGELVWVGGWGYYFGDAPEIIEEGFFRIPVGGIHYINLYGFWIPDETGEPPGSCDYVLYYEVGDNLIDPVAVESSDVTYGELTSYIRNSYIAHMMASYKAAFRGPYGVHQGVVVGVQRANWHYGWTPYALPGFVLCADNPILVGGFDWGLPAEQFSSYQDAKRFMDIRDHRYLIEDVETGQIWALSELTNTKSGPVRPVYHAGEKIGYSKVVEHGLFGPGELADLIGTGLKHLYCYLTFDDQIVFLRWDYYFWLLPEGAMGPG